MVVWFYGMEWVGGCINMVFIIFLITVHRDKWIDNNKFTTLFLKAPLMNQWQYTCRK